jgi:two-component system sensor histidine kinase ChiS
MRNREDRVCWDLIRQRRATVIAFGALVTLFCGLLGGVIWMLLTERERIDRMKDEFLSVASHELRTPMTIMQASVSQVYDGSRGPLNDLQKHALGLSIKWIHHLMALVNDLLDLSRLESGRITLGIGVLRFQDVIDTVGSFFIPALAERHLELRLKLPPVGVQIEGDCDRLLQVVTNLVGNAQKFTKTGWIEIAVTEEAETMECRVSDTGIGIPPEHLPHVFEKFQPWESHSVTGERGTGLGLSIAKKIVELHHGSIRVAPREGGGTEFIFRLPKRQSVIPAPARATA